MVDFTLAQELFYFALSSRDLKGIVSYFIFGNKEEFEVAELILMERGYIGKKVTPEKDEELAAAIRSVLRETYATEEEEEKEVELEVGGLYKWSETNDTYIFSRISGSEYCFISLKNGNRLDDPMELEDWKNYIKYELEGNLELIK